MSSKLFCQRASHSSCYSPDKQTDTGNYRFDCELSKYRDSFRNMDEKGHQLAHDIDHTQIFPCCAIFA